LHAAAVVQAHAFICAFWPVLGDCRGAGDHRCRHRQRDPRSRSRYSGSRAHRSIINTSLSVAEAYLREHGQVIRADLLAMATDLSASKATTMISLRSSAAFFAAQAAVRALPVAMILREDLSVIMESEIDPQSEFLMPPADAIQQARDGEVVVIAPGMSNQVGALVRLNQFENAYLYVARSVDPRSSTICG
jgi:two-component system, NtrC family, nitrogen regulation sensor histidine kinase NtrY